MKKYIIAAVSATAIIAAAQFSAWAESDIPYADTETEQAVSIELTPGEGTIIVNGEAIEAEAPYVVGDGVTLVPLRIITEAFGAAVDWDDAAQTVSLSYHDVMIQLTIGSKAATVNTHTEELEAAAELCNDTTMVPLRFISETFGAVVIYDEQTQLITVTNMDLEDGSLLAGATDKDYIGDSYYGWTMKTPKTYSMSERSPDGANTYFYGNDGSISVYITKYENEPDARAEYNSMLSMYYDSLVSIADMEEVGNGITKLHFRGNGGYMGESDITEYISGKRIYIIRARAYPTDDEDTNTDALYDIAESFSLTDSGRDFYDISSVKDGVCEFANEEYKINVTLPPSWYTYDSIYATNEFIYFDNDSDSNLIRIRFYSKNDMPASELAALNHSVNSYIANPDIKTVSDIITGSFNGVETKEYIMDVRGAGNNKYVMKEIFFEVGEYTYNISVISENESEIDKLLPGITVGELDYEKVGTILKTTALGYDTEIDFAGGKMMCPKYWVSELSPYHLEDNRSGSTIDEETGKISELDKLEEYIEDTFYVTDITAVNELSSETVNGRVIYSQTFLITEDSEADDSNIAYATVYSFAQNNKAHFIVYTRSDINYNSKLDTEVYDMIKNISYK